MIVSLGIFAHGRVKFFLSVESLLVGRWVFGLLRVDLAYGFGKWVFLFLV